MREKWALLRTHMGGIILILALPPFILLTNLYLFASPWLLHHEYNKADFPMAMGFEPQERLSIAEMTVYYLRSKADESLLSALGVYNEREIYHLKDVKRLLGRAFAVQKATGLVIAALLFALTLDERTRRRLPFYVSLGCLLLVLAIGLIAITAYFNFDWFFVRFHLALFEGDSWLFSPSDTLIRLFPPRFWFDTTLMLALAVLLEASLLGAAMLPWVRLRA